MSRVDESLLGQVGGIGEEFLVFVLDGGLIDLPHAATFTVIDNAAAVGREVDGTLLLGCVGNLLGGVEFHRSDIHVAMHHKGYLLAAGRYADGCRSAALDITDRVFLTAVGCNGNVDTLGLTAFTQGIDLAIIAVAQRPVPGYREKSHGIVLVTGELLWLTADAALVDIERAVLLTQVVIGLAVGGPTRCAVLAVERGKLGEFPVLFQPDVTGNGTGVMLAEGVFIPFDVMIEDITVTVDAEVLHRQFREQTRTSAVGTYLIDLWKRAAGKQDGLCRWHIGRLKQHGPVIQETQWGLVTAVGSQPLGRAAILADEIHVQASLACRGKGNALPVRAPHGIGVIGCVGSQLVGRSTLHSNGEEVTLVRECDGLSVRRDGAEAHP